MHHRKRIPPRIRMRRILDLIHRPIRHPPPIIMPHKRPHHIHPRRHPTARPHLPINHPPRARHPLYPLPVPLISRPLPNRLVGRCTSAFQDTRAGERRRARAHREHVLRFLEAGGDEGFHRTVVLVVEEELACAAGHDEDVEGGRGGEGVGGEEGGVELVDGVYEGGVGVEGEGAGGTRGDGTGGEGDGGERHVELGGDVVELFDWWGRLDGGGEGRGNVRGPKTSRGVKPG